MRLFWIFFILAVVFLIPFLIWGGSFEEWLSVDGAEKWLLDYGAWAWAAGIVLLVLDLMLPIPGTAVMAALGLVYGPLIGGLIGSVGSIFSGLLAYGVCRGFGRKAAEKIAGKNTLQRSEVLFVKAGGWVVVLSRWLPIMPEVVSCMAGLSKMPLRIFVAALATGSVPLAFTFSVIGASGRENPFLTFALSISVPPLLWIVVRPFFLRSSRQK